MSTQKSNEQKVKPSLSNLSVGNWIVIIFSILFIISLFQVWASTGGFLQTKGIGFLEIRTSFASGLPQLNLISLLTTIGCILLCIPFVSGKWVAKFKIFSISMITLAFIGMLPFILLPFELKTWTPSGSIEFGAWLAIAATLGIFIGSILNFVKVKFK